MDLRVLCARFVEVSGARRRKISLEAFGRTKPHTEVSALRRPAFFVVLKQRRLQSFAHLARLSCVFARPGTTDLYLPGITFSFSPRCCSHFDSLCVAALVFIARARESLSGLSKKAARFCFKKNALVFNLHLTINLPIITLLFPSSLSSLLLALPLRTNRVSLGPASMNSNSPFRLPPLLPPSPPPFQRNKISLRAF